jgi:hypothetical protein
VDNRCEWIEPDHPILSVRQQAEILGINRSVIYYEPRPKVLSEEQLQLLRLGHIQANRTPSIRSIPTC